MRIYFLLFYLCFSQNTFSQVNEELIFDLHRTDALSLLKNQYKNSKMLFVGFASHTTHQHIDQLRLLLKEVGDDPKLKYIVLERAGDLSPFYESLSENSIEVSLQQHPFQNQDDLKRNLCEPEWAYAIEYLFPEIRKINLNRELGGPILVKTVDGVLSTMDFLRSPYDFNYVVSRTREQDSARIFSREIWETLKDDEKVIVLYNKDHLLRSFFSSMIEMVENDQWVEKIGAYSWLEIFLSSHPTATNQISLVLIDEIGNLSRFGRRQNDRYPTQDWAIPLKPFSKFLVETGSEIFDPESNISWKLKRATSKTLPEIADGLILNASAHLFPNNLESYPSVKRYCQ